MEIIVLTVTILLITIILAVVLVQAFHLINSMNKRVVFLLERMYEAMGVAVTNGIADFDQASKDFENEMNIRIKKENQNNDNFDPFAEVNDGDKELS